MKRCIFGFVILSALAGAAFAEDKKADPEAQKLEGAWEIVSAEIMGKKIDAPKGKGGSFVFGKGMKLIMKDSGKPDENAKYTIDTNKNPKQIDLIELKDGKGGKVTRGIYEIDGDTLRLALSPNGPQGKRPTEFKGDKILILHLKRQKS